MNARRLAARVVADVLEHGVSLTAALEAALPRLASSKDRAFVQALCFGVLRYFHRLDFMLAQLLEKPLKDGDIKALALVGLYQLTFMRVKPHAAVAETVAAAAKKSWAKPLLNALLRRYLRETRLLEQQAQADASASVSHPRWLLNRIRQDWPRECERILAENNRQPPMMLRVNLGKTSRDQYLQRLAQQGLSAAVVVACPAAVLLDKPAAVETLPGFDDGWVSVQDAAAQLAAGLLRLEPGQRVLDVCSAPGGKAAHILELQPGLRELVAVDIDPARLQRVEENLRRLGLKATLKLGDALTPGGWWDDQPFQRILLDVPCSATGVIRRHPDIKVLRKPGDIALLEATQQAILEAIWPLLASDGYLLYATCSVFKQENEAQIGAFLARHADAESVPIEADWGQARPFGRQILTGDSGMDGFYYALLGKR